MTLLTQLQAEEVVRKWLNNDNAGNWVRPEDLSNVGLDGNFNFNKLAEAIIARTVERVVEEVEKYESPFKDVDLLTDGLADWALIEGGATKGVLRAKEDIIKALKDTN
jgi:hypothetical protein